MLMRKLPIRGEKYKLPGGIEVTFLESLSKILVKIILPEGKIATVPKADLPLHVINTKEYEKF